MSLFQFVKLKARLNLFKNQKFSKIKIFENQNFRKITKKNSLYFEFRNFSCGFKFHYKSLNVIIRKRKNVEKSNIQHLNVEVHENCRVLFKIK